MIRDWSWKPLSEELYRELPMRQQSEHQSILAGEARRKAGPQWLSGRPALPSEMPQAWHDLRATAKAHDDEAKRLREVSATYRGNDDGQRRDVNHDQAEKVRRVIKAALAKPRFDLNDLKGF